MLFRGIFEAVGVASILPFIAVVGAPEVIRTNEFLATTYRQLGFTDTNSFLLFLGVASFLLICVSLFVNAATQATMYRFAMNWNFRLTTQLLRNYLDRPYEWFLRQHSGDLGKTVLGDCDRITTFIVLPSLAVASKVVVVVVLLALIIVVNPLVAITAATVLGGAYALTFLATQAVLKRAGKRAHESNEQRYRTAGEALGGFKEVKVLGLEREFAGRFRAPSEVYSRSQATYQLVSDLPRFLLEALAFGGLIATILYFLIYRQEDVGTVLPTLAVYAFAGYRLLPALQQVYQNLSSIRFATATVDRIHREESEARQFEQRRQVTSEAARRLSSRESDLRLEDSILLEDLAYLYPGAERAVLKKVCLEIRARTTVGVVGSTGAGKTTLIDVLMGLLEPSAGRIVVDGVPIDNVNRRAWQAQVGYVPQSIFIVDDTVAANIAFGMPADQIDMSAVVRAAKGAQLHEFVETGLPEGYETKLGERGVRLSGGQRQRVGIARALYRDPSVVIFDEATSALDAVTEKAVMDSIEGLGGHKTIILIAHRISTVRKCDSIVVMDSGSIVANGPYDSLLESSEKFRALVAGKTPDEVSRGSLNRSPLTS
jgi:ABC-type multidrug transport system fused ATPase/permease subunit